MSDTSILLVEDEPSIREVITLYLERAGFQVTSVADGNDALDLLEKELPDLLLLDLMLPGVDGYAITHWLRAHSEIPIIMLTARRELTDRIAGLEMGADDYIVKPFSPQEVVSRVRAVLRRTQGHLASQQESPLTFEGLHIDPVSHSVQVRSEEIQLTSKEFDLLWMLASNPRRVFNRDQLLDRVWGLSEYIEQSTITVHIRRLREKIEEVPSKPRYILTVWGVGYKFEP